MEPSVPSHGDFMKTISVDLGGSTRTRAASALSGEAAIEDATLFVWQHNGKTDETILYEKTYGEASTFEFNLLFSDQTDFTYTINAWANMGELSEEPEDGEVLFSGEESTGLQMKGSKSGIDQSSAASVTIDMKRYVGKITVSEVALEWTNKQNALQEFTLKSIYVANAGDKAEGAVATYNVDGAYVSSAMDAMLYSPVSSVIADGAKYDTPQMMYAYGSGTTELVLECDLGGQTMYYHVPYEPEANTHRAFKLTVRQAGAETPLGELPEEAIEVNVTTLNVLGFEDSEQGVDFGEVPTPVAPVGASIYGVDGKFYSADEWTAAGKSNLDAVGVAVSNGEHSFVIHPTAERSPMAWSNTLGVQIDGVFTTTDRATAESDFAGESNTAAILAAVQAGTIADAPAAVDAARVIFANGKKGYLPSAGELTLAYTVLSDINSCITALHGTKFDMAEKSYMSSTQYSPNLAWQWDSHWKSRYVVNRQKDYTDPFRVFAAL